VYHLDHGQFFLEGKPAVFSSPIHALEQGISMVFQNLTCGRLSVAENLFAQ
jgi:ABC-type sugar transport system ATPase subunit